MPARQALRDNAFIVAAVALPVLVAAFFLVASAVPQLTVPLPAYDAVLKVVGPYEPVTPSIAVDFAIRDNHVVALMKPIAQNGYAERWALLLVDHHTLTARQVPFEVPSRLNDGESERVTVVPELATITVSTALAAPDGYALDTRFAGSGPGLVGELFGMRSYRQRTRFLGRGRSVGIELPAPFQQPYQRTGFLGWITTDGQR